MKKKRIILADDHKIITESLKSILEPTYEVVGIVENGHQLVEEAARLFPDVIIVDISMPKLNGLEAVRQMKKEGIEAKVIPIQPMADAFTDQMPEVLQKDFDIGNLYSELRATVLCRYGAANNCRIMGTGNRDEDYVLGYFTKRGDGAVDNNILGKLPKRLVRELADFLGAPADLVNRVPTAGLWTGQTDEIELGYTYDQAEIIQNGFDEGKTPEEIAKITGYDMKIIKDVDYRHKATEHKRQVPPVGEVKLEYRY